MSRTTATQPTFYALPLYHHPKSYPAKGKVPGLFEITQRVLHRGDGVEVRREGNQIQVTLKLKERMTGTVNPDGTLLLRNSKGGIRFEGRMRTERAHYDTAEEAKSCWCENAKYFLVVEGNSGKNLQWHERFFAHQPQQDADTAFYDGDWGDPDWGCPPRANPAPDSCEPGKPAPSADGCAPSRPPPIDCGEPSGPAPSESCAPGKPPPIDCSEPSGPAPSESCAPSNCEPSRPAEPSPGYQDPIIPAPRAAPPPTNATSGHWSGSRWGTDRFHREGLRAQRHSARGGWDIHTA